MDTNTNTVKNSETAVPQQSEAEAKITHLEAEKNRLIEESSNYKLAFLKEKSKNKGDSDEEDVEDKMRRIATETLTNSRLAEITREKDAIIAKALKENSELKLAQLNKTDVPASTTAHTEMEKVKDTLITPEQMVAFKAKGWTEKDIERYKKNYLKYGGR